jgi:hypothetical protein
MQPNSELVKGLPAVVPPTPGSILKLFLVPLIIVTVGALIILGFIWLQSSSRTPEEFLSHLDNPNADVRWRAANDLAQVLLRDEQLAADPKFALDVAERLRRAIQGNAEAEDDLARRSSQLSEDDRKKAQEALRPGRNYVLYLSACMGNFLTPAGVPLLKETAVSEAGPDSKTVARRRWQAVWALANLGENLKRFDKLPKERQDAIVAQLASEADSAGERRERGEWAAAALKHLKGRQTGQPEALGLDETFARCAEDRTNPFLRETAAFALNFWEGNPAESARMERTLVALCGDTGEGEETLEEFYRDEKPDTRAVTKLPGSRVRYNATVALARRGSDKVRTGLLRDMLDEQKQRANFFRQYLKDGREVCDEATVYNTLHTTLKALVELHRKNPQFDLSELHEAIGRLRSCSNVTVRTQAEETWVELTTK